MANNICSKCGSPLTENTKFCSQCGAPSAVKAEYICPNCKSKVQPGKSYCTNCGTILYSNMSQSFFSETKPSSAAKPQTKDEISDYVDPVSRIGLKSSEFSDISSTTGGAAPQAYARKTAAPAAPAVNPYAAKAPAPNTYTAKAPTIPAPAQPTGYRSTSTASDYRYNQNGYKPPYDSFRPTVSDTGAVPAFSIDGKLPTAAYSEKKANSAAPSGYAPSYTPTAYSQPKPAQFSANPSFAAAASQPVKAAPVQQSQLPIDYTQKIDLKDTEYAASEQQTAKKNVYVDEYDEDFYDDDHPAKGSKYEPVSAWGFVGIMLLASIPVIGWIFVIVWACGGCRKVNKRSWARAALIMTLINILITCAVVYLLTSLFSNIAQEITSSFSGIIDLL